MNTHPPKKALRFLRWFCREDYLDEIEGDLIEIFEEQVKENPRLANRMFAWRVLHYFRPDYIKSFQSQHPLIHNYMLKNHLTSAWRNILKRKEFSLLNLSGLAIGMAACILILQYVTHEKSYDSFHPEASQLYRLTLGMTEGGESELVVRATNHPAAGPSIKEDYPQVEAYARLVDLTIFSGSSVISYERENGKMISFYEEDVYMADPSVLTIFDYPLVEGDKHSALEESNSVVISERMARRYFGAEDPIGKNLTVNGGWLVTVTGILKELPENTHLDITALFSSSNFSDGLNAAWIWPEFYTYVKLKPGTDAKALEAQLDGFAEKYLGEVMENLGIVEKMFLQPVTDIHLAGNLLKEAEENGNYKTVMFLMIIAIMILLIAWINYINLSTSRAAERATEIGIRKFIGAKKKDIIAQFLVESALMNGLAILLSLLILSIAIPFFNQIVGKQVVDIDNLFRFWGEGSIWLGILVIFVGGTVLAGLYPAFVLSSFEPVKTIKGKLFTSNRKPKLRHALVVFQFAISLVMIVGTLTVFHQLSFMRSQDMGFNMDQLLVLKAPKVSDSTYFQRLDYLKNQLLQENQVHSFTISSDIPGHIIQNNNSIKRKEQNNDEAIFATYLFTDESFLETYEIELVAGRNFSREIASDGDAIILTEKAVEVLGFSTADEAIGQVVTRKLNDWADKTVIGVAKDINHRSLAYKQEPIAFFNRQILTDYFTVKVGTQYLAETLEKVDNTFSEFFPASPLEYFFLDEYFSNQYKADQQFGRIFSLFAGLAILVTCIGLFGLLSYITSRRTKEIGIRKILGASLGQILVLLGKQFIWMILLATIVALPLAWWGGGEWLSSYAYQAKLTVWLYLIPVLLVLGIAGATILLQTSKAAKSNPADSLRCE